MGSMSSLRWTQSCQLLENPLSSGTLSNLSVGTSKELYRVPTAEDPKKRKGRSKINCRDE